MKRLAIITTHPIQYNAPLFELLAQRNNIQLKVFYTWGTSVLNQKYDPGFGKVIEWDIPLLNGYEYEFLENIAKDKGSHHFKGIDNPSLIKELEAFMPDSILVYGWSFKSHLKVMRHFRGKIPVLFRGDSTLLDEQGGFKKKLRKLFLKWVYRHVDLALYCGKANRNYFKDMGLKDHQLVFAPHVVDNDRFGQNDAGVLKRVAEMRSELGIPADDFVFLFAGKIESKKNPLLLLESFLESAFANDIHLVFVGNGQLENELKGKAAGNQQIHFIDFVNQSDMPALYKVADVFVLPSQGPGETWGLAINEAMASGIPSIVSDKCGAAFDLVDHRINGSVFTSGQKKALIAEMSWMLSRRNNMESIRQSVQEKINEFSLIVVAESIEGVVNIK